MYKLLLVDDEKQIRDGLKKIIPWEDYGICICGEASDGREALELIRKEHPQIIITDIQMPGMDGIELMQMAQEENESIQFIVLSGYNDFPLVRKAMRAGAVDYLLKPSSREDIVQIIDEITENIEETVPQQKNTESFGMLKRNILNRLLGNHISPTELKDKMEVLELALPEGSCRVGLVEFDWEESREEQRFWKSMEICNLCEKIVETEKKGLCFLNALGEVCLIMCHDDVWTTENKENNMLSHLAESIEKELQITISVIVGDWVKTWRSLSVSYRKAKEISEHSSGFGEKDFSMEKNDMANQIQYRKLVMDMIQCIEKNYSNQDLSLQYLAADYHLNTAYLGRIFKKETGVSFNDFLSNMRIGKAKELLRTTNYKGNELSEKVGFANYNYFYIVFKKITGMNPMEFRKQ